MITMMTIKRSAPPPMYMVSVPFEMKKRLIQEATLARRYFESSCTELVFPAVSVT
jgi:hypothetical protein